jgi:hypothetical protein
MIISRKIPKGSELADKLSIVAAIIGVASLLMGLYMVNATVALVESSQSTTAAVVYYNQEGRILYPVLSFRDASGSTVTAQSIDGGTTRSYRVGERIQIIYDPTNPTETTRINSFVNIWLGPLFLTAMGAVDAVLSLVVYFLRGRRQVMSTSPVAHPHGSG